MDIKSEDILKQLLERLDKMDTQQYKQDRMMERLDTIQNIIESQNQKQNFLDEKLVAITTKLQQEKGDMRQQLQEALQEIAEPICGSDSKEGCSPSPHKSIQPLQSLGKQIGDKLKSIDDRTNDTAQMSQQLILLSRQIEDKLTELAGKSMEMKTFLEETRNANDLIQGETKSQLTWINNLTDNKLSDIASVVNKICRRQTEAKEAEIRFTGQPPKTNKLQDTIEPLSDKPKLTTTICDEQIQAILDLDRKLEHVNSTVLDMSRDVKTYLDTILTTNKQSDLEKNSKDPINESSKEKSFFGNETFKSDLNKCFEVVQEELQKIRKTSKTESRNQSRRIISVIEIAKEDLRHLILTEGDNTNKYKVEMENFNSSVSSLLDRIHENVKAVLEKVDSREISMIARYTTLIKQMKDLSTQTKMNKQLEKLTNDMKDYIYQIQRGILAVTEKEAQIVRDRIQGPLVSPGNYTFDFYVDNFKSLVRSGKRMHSLPWHINELQTCVTGYILMSTNGDIEVWLLYGRHPREVGLQPRSGKTIKVKAIICDICNKKIQPLDIGEQSWSFDEAAIPRNFGCGNKVGVTSCDELIERGYGKQEGYAREALLIRYDITVE